LGCDLTCLDIVFVCTVECCVVVMNIREEKIIRRV
jgi:hypothetical protein